MNDNKESLNFNAPHLTPSVVRDALRRHIENWYLEAYGTIDSHRVMIDWYSGGSPQRIDTLLGPLQQQMMETPPRRVLDVGCGYANVPVYLAYLWPQSEIVATDISENYYRCGAAAARDLNLNNVRFELLPVGELVERDSYDLVLCCNMLNFMTSHSLLQDALTRLWAASKKNGHLAIHTPHYWNLREPFTRIPLLHLLPISWQDKIVRRLGKRSTLLDVRNPSVGEIRDTLLSCGARQLGMSPGSKVGRFRSTHVTLWFEK